MEEMDEKAIEESDRIHHPYADENGVEWTVEAWERVKHAPEFVRPGIRKLMVQRAVKRGYKYITSDYLTEIRNESMMLVSKRVKQFGFEELSMGAFDVGDGEAHGGSNAPARDCSVSANARAHSPTAADNSRRRASSAAPSSAQRCATTLSPDAESPCQPGEAAAQRPSASAKAPARSSPTPVTASAAAARSATDTSSDGPDRYAGAPGTEPTHGYGPAHGYDTAHG